MQREPLTWGYCRISTIWQSLSRQEHNILQAFPQAVIVKEIFTGASLKRPEFERILKKCLPGDNLVFDEVSRMSRNADDGFETWKRLYEQGINLYFLKEPHINTDVYKDVIKNKIPLMNDDIDLILEAVNSYLLRLAEKQIRLAFLQAENEAKLLRQRTSEGMRQAALQKGKILGRPAGRKYETKKAKNAKTIIIKHNRFFGNGNLTDKETITLTKLDPKTFYKYKKELQMYIEHISTEEERSDVN